MFVAMGFVDIEVEVDDIIFGFAITGVVAVVADFAGGIVLQIDVPELGGAVFELCAPTLTGAMDACLLIAAVAATGASTEAEATSVDEEPAAAIDTFVGIADAAVFLAAAAVAVDRAVFVGSGTRSGISAGTGEDADDKTFFATTFGAIFTNGLAALVSALEDAIILLTTVFVPAFVAIDAFVVDTTFVDVGADATLILGFVDELLGGFAGADAAAKAFLLPFSAFSSTMTSNPANCDSKNRECSSSRSLIRIKCSTLPREQ
mmetsp:Transcript_15224/g.22789  ORF Transcript_15224/g.22789 Transcript_15224/m.22789 type:complete len:262 (+) Transcript_15224:529-1314(+)